MLVIRRDEHDVTASGDLPCDLEPGQQRHLDVEEGHVGRMRVDCGAPLRRRPARATICNCGHSVCSRSASSSASSGSSSARTAVGLGESPAQASSWGTFTVALTAPFGLAKCSSAAAPSDPPAACVRGPRRTRWTRGKAQDDLAFRPPSRKARMVPRGCAARRRAAAAAHRAESAVHRSSGTSRVMPLSARRPATQLRIGARELDLARHARRNAAQPRQAARRKAINSSSRRSARDGSLA